MCHYRHCRRQLPPRTGRGRPRLFCCEAHRKREARLALAERLSRAEAEVQRLTAILRERAA